MQQRAQDGPGWVRMMVFALAATALMMGLVSKTSPLAEPASQMIALVPDEMCPADVSPPATVASAPAPGDFLALEPTTMHDPLAKLIGPPVYEHWATNELWRIACFEPPHPARDLVAMATPVQEVDAIRLFAADFVVRT